MNENRLNYPEIQDAHLDQMIRLVAERGIADRFHCGHRNGWRRAKRQRRRRNRNGQSGF